MDANYDLARANMIEQQIRPWDVLDQKVLDVISVTPRELFVPSGKEHLAFADLRLPLDHDKYMMTPKVEARILQSLALQSTDTVLEVGTGSGYLTACLATMSAQVDSLEIHGDLSSQAKQRLEKLSIDNVELQICDVMQDWQPDKKYDAIVLTGSLPAYAPQFEEVLSDNGRLFMIVGDAPAMQATLYTRNKDGEIEASGLFETNIQALLGSEAKEEFVF